MRLNSTLGAGLVCAATLATPTDSHAGARDRSWWEERGDPKLDAYAMLKGGGMMLGAGASTGGYFGFEIGQNVAQRFDFGFSVDWYHRHSRDLELVFESDHTFDPPIRGQVTRFESSSDFVPLGLTMRLQIPLRNEVVVPFLSGTVAYEVLHVEFFDRDRIPNSWDNLLGASQTLMGFGWQMAGGLNLVLAPGFGLFGEAGMHRSEPSRTIDAWGLDPVDVSANLNGGFLRAGLRLDL